MIEDKYKNNLKVVNLSGYQSPEVVEVHNKEWVLYLCGDVNQDYFESLIEKYLGSPTNARCINGISDMIYGRGLDATDSAEKPEMYAKMKLLLQPREMAIRVRLPSYSVGKNVCCKYLSSHAVESGHFVSLDMRRGGKCCRTVAKSSSEQA